MQLINRYMPTDKPQHRAKLLKQLVLFDFVTTSVPGFEASYARLRELHDQARDVDSGRTEADFDAAVLVAIQNTTALASLYQILDATGPPERHAADYYFSKVRSFLEDAAERSKTNPRQLEPTGLATNRFSGAGGAAQQPPPCVMCRFALGASAPIKRHAHRHCPVMLHFWEKFGKPGETKQANLADAADVDGPSQEEPAEDAGPAEQGDELDGHPNLEALAAWQLWDEGEEYDPFAGFTAAAVSGWQGLTSTFANFSLCLCGVAVVLLLLACMFGVVSLMLSHFSVFTGAVVPYQALVSARTNVEHLIVDSGCNFSVFKSKSLFKSLEPVTVAFGTNGDTPFTATGKGTVSVRVRDISGSYVPIELQDVYYAPKSRYNLVSVRTLVKQYGWVSPRFDTDVWTDARGNNFSIAAVNSLPALVVRPSEEQLVEGANFSANIATAPVPAKDTSDLQLIRSAYRLLCGLTKVTGGYDVDCFTDGLGPVRGNSHCPAYFSRDDPVESHVLAGKSFYASPPFETNAICSLLAKMVRDFEVDPENTSYLVILPVKRGAPWWPLTSYFQEVKIWPKGSELFTYHGRNLHTLQELRPAGSEGGPGRYFLSGAPWEVVALFKNKFTPVKMDDYHLLHCRFGHSGPKVMQKLLEINPTAGKGLDAKVFASLHVPHKCATCILCNMQRPGSFKLASKEYRKDWPIFSYIVTDIKVMSLPSCNGHLYILQFSCGKSKFTKLYFMQSKTEVAIHLRDFIAWCTRHGFKPERMLVKSDAEAVFVGPHCEFRRACEQHNISQCTSAPYLHELNGMAEANFKAISMKVRAVMRDAGPLCTPDLWPYAYKYANDIRNSLPHSGINFAVPYAIVFGRQRDLSCFKVFFSQVYSHVDENLRKGFDDHARMGFFLGVDDESGCYLVLDPATRRVYRRGRALVVEDTKLLGRLMAADDVDADKALHFGGEPLGSAPPSPFYADMPAGSGGPSTKVVGVSAYFNETDGDSVALVNVQTEKHYQGFWTTALSFLTTFGDASRAYTLLTRYMAQMLRAGALNTVYPLLAVVQSNPPGEWDVPGPFECIVVSVDSATPPVYRVVHDPSTGFDPGIDVEAAFIVFDGSPTALLGERSGSKSPRQVPVTVRQALLSPEAPRWVDSMLQEFTSMQDLGTFTEVLSELPPGVKPTPSKPVFAIKEHPTEPEVLKTRIVIRGDLQADDTFDSTFAPVAADNSLMVLLNIALQSGLELYQLDVKTAFLNSPIEFDIWVELPADFHPDLLAQLQAATRGGDYSTAVKNILQQLAERRKAGKKLYVKLEKSVYGLRQAAGDWSKTLNTKLMKFDPRLQRSKSDACLYFIFTEDLKFLISVHVDDFAIASSSVSFYEKFKSFLQQDFQIKDLGKLNFILNMEIKRTPTSITISQERMINDLAEKYGLANCKPKFQPFPVGTRFENLAFEKGSEILWYPFRQLIGSMLWVGRKSRPDIYWAVIYLSQFASCYSKAHWDLAKKVLQYLVTTKHYVLKLEKASDSNLDLYAFCDSDWAGDKLDRRSYSGHAIFMSGNLIAWGSQKQSSVALSSTEAEYISLSEIGKSIMHLLEMTEEIFPVRKPITIYCDNQGAVFMSKNSTTNKRSKHIDIRYHYVRELIQERKALEVVYIPTEDNLADQLTKTVTRESILQFVNLAMKGV